MKRFLVLMTIVFGSVTMNGDFARAEGANSRAGATLDQKLTELNQALDELKTSHQEIISSQMAIKQELASLRVWIQKRR